MSNSPISLPRQTARSPALVGDPTDTRFVGFHSEYSFRVLRPLPATDVAGDKPRRALRGFMRPNAEHLPTTRLQRSCDPRITLLVTLDLLFPPCTVCLGPRAVGGAAMPEATIDEHSDLSAGKDQVSSRLQIGNGPAINTETKPLAMNERADRNLARGVSLPRCSHSTPHFLR